MLVVILGLALILAMSKWMIYRLSLMAVLLYYAECGVELPDKATIQKYQMKVVEKSLGVKGDGSTL